MHDVRALARHALAVIGAQHVFRATDDLDLRSWPLAGRAGVEHEGSLRQDCPDLQGRLRNTRVHAMVAQERT